MNLRLIPLSLICLTFITQSVFAEKTLVSHDYGKDTTIEVIDMFDNLNTRSGYHPYLVKISNNRAKAIIWNFKFECSNYAHNGNTEYSQSIKVEPGSDSIDEIYVPVPHSMARFKYSITADRGLKSLQFETGIYGVEQDWPAIGISKPLALKSLTSLAAKKLASFSGTEYFATTYNDLPINWKGYTCLDVFMIDEKKWLDISKEQRKAIFTWVRFGGTLHLFTSKKKTPSYSALKLDEPDKTAATGKGVLLGGNYGFGKASVYRWDGRSLDDSIVSRYKSLHRFDHSLIQNFGRSWALIRQFGEKNFNPTFVFFLLIIFAIIIGPVNLFQFAKPGKRHRLFITTPIISIIAALIIVAIILIQDGTGGSGKRIAFMEIQSDPEQRQLQIIQQQISRTGVMINSGFSNKAQPQIMPINVGNKNYSTINSTYNFADGDFSGDFFRSRNEQGFYLREVRPTRSRIEVNSTSTSAPNLTSSLDFAVKNFFYIDTKGTVWSTTSNETINPGQLIQLKKSNASKLISYLDEASSGFGRFERERIKSMREHRNRYFAEAINPKQKMIQTHSSIKWLDDLMIVSGQAVAP